MEIGLYPDPPTGWDHVEMSARYTGASLLNTFVAVFSFGTIFLTFDIQIRDTRNRIHEVLDSLPASNFEIIVGRVAGILLLLLLPCILFLILVGCYESISLVAGVRYRMGLQPLSIVAFVLWNIIPNLVFFGSLVACLSVLFRNRLIVALFALGALFGSVWVANRIPVRLMDSLSQYVGSALFPSELAPVFWNSTIVCSRIAILLISFALLFFAASLLPRTEPRRTSLSILGLTILGGGVALIFGLVFLAHSTENVKAHWVKTHRQQSHSAFPDTLKVAGNIELHPGRNIALDVTLSVLPPTANVTESVVFSLNPGYKIQKVSVDGTETTDFSFARGILKLPANLLPDTTHDIQIQAKGKPDHRFAYLDQARDFQKLTDSSVPKLGLRSFIFHSDFVALMPGIVWYPISGTAINRDDIEERPRDLFTTDLTVSVPRNWQVATIGKRQIDENATRRTFQFTNLAPVPELALLASKFEQRSMTIDGVVFEVLFSKKHLRSLDLFAPAIDQVRDWIVGQMNRAKSLSLEYPYDAFYVVEVPSHLRIYGGGWRMESVLQPPGMMLVRETAFPTAPFEHVISENIGDSTANSRSRKRAFSVLLRYFRNDEQGGNPFAGIARNFVSHQVSVTGRGATVLQYLLDQLSSQLITQIDGSYVISESEYATSLPNYSLGDSMAHRDSNNVTSRRVHIASLPSTWQLLEQIALFDLDFDAYPILAYRVLQTKGHALAKFIISYYGAEKVGMFLDQLRLHYQGQSFTLEDLINRASSIGIDLKDWGISWLEDTVLPGFVTTIPTVSKLINTELGAAEYQTSFILHNAEPLPGFVQVVWSDGDDSQNTWNTGFTIPQRTSTHSERVFLNGHQSKQIAIQSINPLTKIQVNPSLSLNRTSIGVFVPDFLEDDLPESSALPFVADCDWKPANTKSFTIDDLDSGFSIITLGINNEDSIGAEPVSIFSIPEEEHEGGLPLRAIPWSGEWQRKYHSLSHGHYLRTHAEILRGKGTSAAQFETSLPHAGLWYLEFFVPISALERESPEFPDNFLGSAIESSLENWINDRQANPNAPNEHYRLKINDGITERKKTFDIANAHAGWNEVGKFDLGSTEVSVLLSDWAGHEEVMVYADAIRWTPDESE